MKPARATLCAESLEARQLMATLATDMPMDWQVEIPAEHGTPLAYGASLGIDHDDSGATLMIQLHDLAQPALVSIVGGDSAWTESDGVAQLELPPGMTHIDLSIRDQVFGEVEHILRVELNRNQDITGYVRLMMDDPGMSHEAAMTLLGVVLNQSLSAGHMAHDGGVVLAAADATVAGSNQHSSAGHGMASASPTHESGTAAHDAATTGLSSSGGGGGHLMEREVTTASSAVGPDYQSAVIQHATRREREHEVGESEQSEEELAIEDFESWAEVETANAPTLERAIPSPPETTTPKAVAANSGDSPVVNAMRIAVAAVLSDAETADEISLRDWEVAIAAIGAVVAAGSAYWLNKHVDSVALQAQRAQVALRGRSPVLAVKSKAGRTIG